MRRRLSRPPHNASTLLPTDPHLEEEPVPESRVEESNRNGLEEFLHKFINTDNTSFKVTEDVEEGSAQLVPLYDFRS